MSGPNGKKHPKGESWGKKYDGGSGCMLLLLAVILLPTLAAYARLVG